MKPDWIQTWTTINILFLRNWTENFQLDQIDDADFKNWGPESSKWSTELFSARINSLSNCEFSSTLNLMTLSSKIGVPNPKYGPKSSYEEYWQIINTTLHKKSDMQTK